MNITIVGGGNIGTQIAVHCAEKGNSVTMFTSIPDIFEKNVKIIDDIGNITHAGKLKEITNDPAKAFSCADIVLVSTPAAFMDKIGQLIYLYASKKTIIGIFPGSGGCEYAFMKCINRGNIFFGLERVPAMARLVEKGKVVRCTGYRKELHISSIPSDAVEYCCSIVSSIYDIPCKTIYGYLNITLTPSNPILHTTRLKTVFSDYYSGRVYYRLPLFYEDWDDASSTLLIQCDQELQKICKAYPELNLINVKSLCEHYESYTVQDMTKKISSISSFQGAKLPVLSVSNGYIPDLQSRCFTSDFNYGLSIIDQIADFAKVDDPMIKSVLSWYRKIAILKKEFNFSDYGIDNVSMFKEFYMR